MEAVGGRLVQLALEQLGADYSDPQPVEKIAEVVGRITEDNSADLIDFVKENLEIGHAHGFIGRSNGMYYNINQRDIMKIIKKKKKPKATRTVSGKRANSHKINAKKTSKKPKKNIKSMSKIEEKEKQKFNKIDNAVKVKPGEDNYPDEDDLESDINSKEEGRLFRRYTGKCASSRKAKPKRNLKKSKSKRNKEKIRENEKQGYDDLDTDVKDMNRAVNKKSPMTVKNQNYDKDFEDSEDDAISIELDRILRRCSRKRGRRSSKKLRSCPKRSSGLKRRGTKGRR